MVAVDVDAEELATTEELIESLDREAITVVTGAVAGSAYTASKHGLIGLTRSIAALYAEDGIRAVAVCPGGVETSIGRSAFPQSPWAYRRLEHSFDNTIRMAKPPEIATLICWLGSDEAVNINGAVITSDGGWTS